MIFCESSDALGIKVVVLCKTRAGDDSGSSAKLQDAGPIRYGYVSKAISRAAPVRKRFFGLFTAAPLPDGLLIEPDDAIT
jgi:hypothetical protein